MFNLDQAITEWRRQMLAAGIKTPVPLEELECHLREDIEQQTKSGLSETEAFSVAAQRIGQASALKCEFRKNERHSTKRMGIFAGLIGTAIILRIVTKYRDLGYVLKSEQLEWLLVGVVIVLFGLSTAIFSFKLGDAREVRLWKLVGISYSLFAVWVSMLPIASFLTVPRLSAAFSYTDRTFAFTAMVVSGLSILGWRFCRGILPVIASRRSRTEIGIVCCLSGPGSMAAFLYFVMPQLGHVPAPLFVVLITWAWTLMAILGGVGYGLTEAARRQTATADS